MQTGDWVEILKATAWPLVGLLTLIYIWRSDAIGKLIKISEAVKELRLQLKELVEVEEQLRQSISSIGEVNLTVGQIQSDFQEMRADVENIRDRVDQRSDAPSGIATKAVDRKQLDALFREIDTSWQKLNQALQAKFGWFDARSTGSAAYRFAHGNRKTMKLTPEQAEEIARLHSSIKSYRRRHSSLADWLTVEVKDEFVSAAAKMAGEVEAL